mmetsp:Transcript_19433/g.45218  ORF Transcript_19433/g.45218 Transcript_19433/m.45218 type:complete len:193 (-) Transcript_19433:184-762(-)|eukprot:CAMPEP_0116830608 /NCGR_PEP_ID=MMETSP0418-20121206/4855_1 /TAXON_ID=1158023 /ORGANISM="Astrosyne radiata, Strain 13vi08-1A" /LENGTH=192 /DNA_ID=CAMNT_0004459725 /DNA_START=82 /DNA_END=660 /DNA_ORIENTATION=-
MGNANSSAQQLPPLVTAPNCDTKRFMGTWFVIAVKPTIFEKTCSNAVERYSLKGEDKVNIDFRYNKDEPITSPLKSLPQKGFVQGDDKSNSGEWRVSPFPLVKMPYLILEVDEDKYNWCVIGYPSRDYCWIMCRTPQMKEKTYNMLTDNLVKKHQYDLEGLRKVPQKWTEEERTKRSLVKEIPDSMLSSGPN